MYEEETDIEDKMGLPRQVGRPGCKADLEWEEEGEFLVVKSLLEARSKGDEIIDLYTSELQRIADKTGRIVVSREVPMNIGAWKLFERSPGYTRLKDKPNERTDFGIYERTFIPTRPGGI